MGRGDVSAFIDTCVLVAFGNIKDKNYAKAAEIIKRAARGEYGLIFSSDYVFDETLTLALMLTKNPAVALEAGELILGSSAKGIPSFIELLWMDNQIFFESWSLFKKYAAKGLSFTDCTTVALIMLEKIDVLLSFDRSFDGIVKRVG